MAWVLEGSTTFNIDEAGGNQNVTTPGTPVENNLVIYAESSDNLVQDGGSTVSVQTTGFTDRSWDNTNINPGNETGFKQMTATPDSSITFNVSGGSEQSCGVMQTWSGADTTTPEDVTATSANGSSTNADPSAITTVTDGCLIVVIAHVDDDNTAGTTAAPSGYTNLTAHDNAGTPGPDNATVAMASKEQATLGLENPGTFTTSDDAWATVTYAFRPAAGVAANPKGPLGMPLRGPFGGPI